MIIYPCHNRAYYTGITLPQVVMNAPEEVVIYDDNSSDHTGHIISGLNVNVEWKKGNFGHSCYCINDAIKTADKYIIKVDNDILIPDGYFDFLIDVMEKHKDYGFIAMKECRGLPRIGDQEIEEARFIGGVGIFRVDALCEVTLGDRYFGFQDVQTRSKYKKGWLKNCFNTNLDLSNWSRSKEFKEKGYSREINERVRSAFQ